MSFVPTISTDTVWVGENTDRCLTDELTSMNSKITNRATISHSHENYAEKTKNVLFMSVDGVKFRRQVKPGDQLKMHVERTKARRNIFVFKAVAMVDEQVACEAELTAMILD